MKHSKTAFSTLGTFGKTAHIVGGVISIVMVPIDLFWLVQTSKEIHYYDLPDIAIRLCAQLDEIKEPLDMIEKKLKDDNSAINDDQVSSVLLQQLIEASPTLHKILAIHMTD
jgi:hypothetical protein